MQAFHKKKKKKNAQEKRMQAFEMRYIPQVYRKMSKKGERSSLVFDTRHMLPSVQIGYNFITDKLGNCSKVFELI